MSTQFSILFYAKTSKTLKTGLIPIYLRITIGGQRFESTTDRSISLSKWSKNLGKAIGNTEEIKQLNVYLETLRHRAYSYQQQIVFDGKDVTVENFREKWIGVKEKPRMLL